MAATRGQILYRLVMTALGLTLVIMTAVLVHDIHDYKIYTAKRATIQIKDIYTPTLVNLALVPFMVDVFTVLITFYNIYREKRQNHELSVVAVEKGHLGNYCIYLGFLMLTKGISYLLSIFFLIFVSIEMDDLQQKFQWDENDRNTMELIEKDQVEVLVLILLNLFAFMAFLCSGALGCFMAGKRQATPPPMFKYGQLDESRV
mmetsp:Transcript_26513/g.30438  ORF Transcript_26513/g.30438 Transcript_26513/m.30438 type:complete len:203 (+) Transcript_26513:209-817(+)